MASLANDVTIEGSAMNGVVQGAEAVRSIVTYIRTLYALSLNSLLSGLPLSCLCCPGVSWVT